MPRGGVSGNGGLQTRRVTLTAAQVLSLHTTPVEVISAPGAGLSNDVVAAELVYDFVSTAYTDGGGHLLLRNGVGGSYQTAALTTNGFWTLSASQKQKLSVFAGSNSVAIADDTNQPTYISQDTANPTLGDGTLTIDLLYRVVAVS